MSIFLHYVFTSITYYHLFLFPSSNIIIDFILPFLNLRKVLDLVGAVRVDSASVELLLSVGGVGDDTGLLVNNGEGGESLVVAKLVAPGGGDGEGSAGGRSAVGHVGLLAILGLDNVGASGGSGSVGVDAEGEGALGVVLEADTLHGGDSPVRDGSGHGNNIGSRGGDGAGGKEDESGELHGDDVVWKVLGD